MNLNGDYFFDVVVVVVGGLGMGFGVNIGDSVVIFEVIYGIVFKYVGLDWINFGFVIFFGVMMLEFMGWQEVVDLIKKGIGVAIVNWEVIYDLVWLMELKVDKFLKCFEFVQAIVSYFDD